MDPVVAALMLWVFIGCSALRASKGNLTWKVF